MPLTLGISAGTSLLSGLFGSKGASRAAKQAAEAIQNSQQYANDKVASGQQAIGQGIGTVDQQTVNGQNKVAGATNAALGSIGSGVGASLQALAGGTGASNQLLSTINPQQLALLAPFLGAGNNSVNSLQALAGPGGPLTKQFSFNPSNLQNDPGYQFTLQQGQQAIQRAAAAQGGLFSTGTLKSLAGYTTGSANQYFNDAFNRALGTFNTNRQGVLSQINTLQGLAGLGYGAAGTGVGAIGQVGAQQGQNLFNAGVLGAQNLYGGGLAAAQTGLGGAEYGAGLGVQGAGLNLQGREAQANLGLGGAQINASLAQALANARAGGTLGQTNSWLSALNGASNSLLGYLSGTNSFNPNPQATLEGAAGALDSLPPIGSTGGGAYVPPPYVSDPYASIEG